MDDDGERGESILPTQTVSATAPCFLGLQMVEEDRALVTNLKPLMSMHVCLPTLT